MTSENGDGGTATSEDRGDGTRKLEDRTAIVTGASSAIGRAIAIEFAREGASIVVADVRERSRAPHEKPSTAEVIEADGARALFVHADVTDDDDVRTLIDRTVEEFGGVDILVNSAGVTTNGTVEDVSEDEWDRVHDVNVKGIVRCSKHALPHLRESDHGRIVNISSQRGLRGGASTAKAAYVSSKGAVTNLTRQMALDYGPEGIAVNAICPGPVESGMTPIESEADRQELLEGVLTSFVGQPEDIAPAAVLLASDGGRYIHGHNLVVDGGYLVK